MRGKASWTERPEPVQHELKFDLRPRVGRSSPAQVIGAPGDGTASVEVRDEPRREDLVFCAVGDTGSGLAGTHRVAASIAIPQPTPVSGVVKKRYSVRLGSTATRSATRVGTYNSSMS